MCGLWNALPLSLLGEAGSGVVSWISSFFGFIEKGMILFEDMFSYRSVHQ